MSDTSKIPFDSVPLDGAGGTATLPETRPSFSRNSMDMPTSGLLPPSRRPLSVSTPEPTTPTPPVLPPAPEPAAPNPMASTPPPKAGSLRGFLWDLVRPTRTKWAVLAGGVSLAAGAYGLNLFVPTPAEAPRKPLPETAKLPGPGPQVMDERQRSPSVGEERVVKPAPVIGEERTAAVPPAVKDTPAPLPALSVPTPIVPATAAEPIKLVKNEQPADPPPLPPLKPDSPLPPVPVADEKPKTTALPSVPGLSEKPEPVTPAPPVKPAEVTPTPLPVVKPADPAPPPVVPVKPADPTPAPAPLPAVVMPGGGEKKPELPAAPKPAGFAEKPDPIPALTPVNDPKTIPLPGVKVTSVGDEKLPPVGTPADPPKPVEGAPIPKPSFMEVKAVDPVPAPPVKADPIPVPAFTEKKPDVPSPPAPPVKIEPVAVPSASKEEKTPPAAMPVGGATAPPAVVGGPPPKKGFEVDVVKVRPTDTYTGISEAFYQSKKYAASLRAFNGDVDINRLQEVEVPPLFELQKLTTAPARDAAPTGRTVNPRTGSEPAVRGPVIEPTAAAGESVDWGPVGNRRAVTKYERFTTPKEGMTARDVARAVYADENEWAKLIGPRGTKLRADDPLPRGTELTVPREELPWK